MTEHEALQHVPGEDRSKLAPARAADLQAHGRLRPAGAAGGDPGGPSRSGTFARALQRRIDIPVFSWGTLLDYAYSVAVHRDYYGHV